MAWAQVSAIDNNDYLCHVQSVAIGRKTANQINIGNLDIEWYLRLRLLAGCFRLRQS